jgi:PAS domain S-box-containing protein
MLSKKPVRVLRQKLRKGREKFRQYIEHAPDGVFVFDETGRYCEVNPAGCRITGYSEQEMLAMTIADILAPESVAEGVARFAELRNTGAIQAELRFCHRDGSYRWWSIDAVKLTETRFLSFSKDITERKMLEATQHFLLNSGYDRPGEDFFAALARHLGDTLGVYYVCIDRLSGDRLQAETLAVYCDGRFEDNLEYTLADTPCGRLLEQKVCFFPQHVAALFPRDPALTELQAESYIGTALYGFGGKPIGLIALLDRKPMKNSQMAETLLRMVSVRAAGELERLQGMAALRQSAEVQAVLREIAQAAAVCPSIEEFYATVHRLVARVLPARIFYFAFIDEATNRVHVPYCSDEMDYVPRERPVGRGLTEYVMRRGQAVHVTTEGIEALMAAGEITLRFAKQLDYLGVPLTTPQGKPIGVIAMNLPREHDVFCNEQVEVISVIAAQVSLAIVRKQAEEALAESEARYRALLEQAPEAILVIDPQSGKILETNTCFTERFGYDLRRDGPLRVQEITLDTSENIESLLDQSQQSGSLPLQRRVIRHRNGFLVEVERSATIVCYRNRSLLTVTLRDVSEEIRREREIHRDAQMATRVQSAMLTVPAASDHIDIRIIYQPHSYVGGDLYFLDWRYKQKVLRGFLVDTSGHGLSTALHTSAMHVLLREVNELDLPISEQMRWLNHKAHEYFAEGTFAGALIFELDLQTRSLRWAHAGIPEIWMETRSLRGIVRRAGMFLGMKLDENFETHELPIEAEDYFCFLTDGLTDIVVKHEQQERSATYSAMVEQLQSLAESATRRDDATAICVQVRSLPDILMQQACWPRKFSFSGYGDYQRLKNVVSHVLAEVTGLPHSIQEVAANEALANAMECRDSVSRQHHAQMRINLIGRRLIIRVKTSRIGFAGNAVLRRLRAHPTDMFSFGEDATMGRGIPIMLSLAHKMTYNSEGTEVLLAWRLVEPLMQAEPK